VRAQRCLARRTLGLQAETPAVKREAAEVSIDLNVSREHSSEVAARTTTSAPAPGASLWYKDAVIYQLHVKAFADSNGDGIGDFRGLIDRLPYIRDLGASAVWLLPFYPSPLRDDGYDIADYKGIHPSYGTMRDFRLFVRAAHRLGLRVITELVINHTSDQHPWFERARRAPRGSAYRDWYVWSDTPEKYAETRIIFVDTETSNWTWDPVAKQYYWHRFFSHQPDLNFDNPKVFEAVVDVMRFWFDAGVDGVRLDAVPYLVEREGTNNENLPETHTILKRLRAVVDAEYPDRFFLAEANQWPEDVAEYFGDGDECHMAFHFPLMPRMFMSIAEEDRYPIVDIMRQTPPIPDNCQWAMFLRNHDELTLEMVTDRERAFLYRVYAPDSRARVNVGIRRRLAPLMENDRRRIELMTSLLLSMPGTPVVYYGDEIGMGDNIYLGDRDGVRTPMQWSGDRNGGFSRADAQRLFLPAIMDVVYGYPGVNVEAQERSPSSLLHWVKRLIGVRQSHAVFGRGTLSFLYPENRRVVAYVREYEDEVVLCVANLARTPQPVALDLSRFAGRVPIEMIGWSSFPPVGDDRYVLTLPGHAFFWFLLVTTAPDSRETTARLPTQMPEFATLVLPNGWRSLTHAPSRALLETEVVPPYLAAIHAVPQLGTARPQTRMVDAIALASGAQAPLIALFASTLENDDIIYSAIPLSLAFDDGKERSPAVLRAAIARTRTGPREALLIDASADDTLWIALARALRDGTVIAGESGTLRAESTWSFDGLVLAEGEVVRRPATQGRHATSILGETLLFTLYRRTQAGVNPEIELARFLHDAGFAHTPPLMGTIVYEDRAGNAIGIGVVHRYVLNRGSGWDVTQTYLQRYLELRRGTPLAETEREGEPDIDYFAPEARRAGERLAALHLTFAQSDDAAFAAEPISPADRDTWIATSQRRTGFAFDRLAIRLRGATAALREDMAELLGARTRLDRAIANGAAFASGVKIRIHGDLHLARFLVTEADLLIVDPGAGDEFLPPAERRRKATPLRDVARMLRSLEAAATSALREVGTDRTENADRFARELSIWTERATRAFLDGYSGGVNQTILDVGDAQPFRERVDALALHDAVDALAVALAENSSSLRFYVRNLMRRIPA
jgi:maltose alpha-D-glucosyltransferase/alpha-amylase